MFIKRIQVIARKELQDALRARWFILYTAAFTFLAGSLSYLATSYAGFSGLQGFGRTAAGLVNLVLLIVPLMGFTAGAQAVAAERDQGTLGYLLTQPITRSGVLVGKFLGLAVTLMVAVLISFGLTGLMLAARGLPVGLAGYGLFTLLTMLLALSSLSLGMLISALVPRIAGALGATVFLWLALVFLGDLGVMGTTVAMQLGIQPVFVLSLFNPLQVFRIATISGLHATLDLLGPVGRYAWDLLGRRLPWVFTGVLLLWVAVPFFIARAVFQRRDYV